MNAPVSGFRRPLKFLHVCFAAGLVFEGNIHAADQVLVDLSHFDFSKIKTGDATVSETKSDAGLPLRMAASRQQEWPWIVLPAPEGTWNLAANAEVTLKVKNVGKSRVWVFCRVDNAGADDKKNCGNSAVPLAPGKTDTLRVVLTRGKDTLGGQLFGMMGYPTAAGSGEGGIDASKVTALVLFVKKPHADNATADYAIEIGDIRATGEFTPPTACVTDATPFFPFIDTFGQYKHKDWPGKTKSLADLVSKRDTEAKDLAEKPAPEGWDKYGGWGAGPALKATGFFRTEKVQGKWWLVDPDGHLFFSQGIDCVDKREGTPVDDRDGWFDDFPGDKPEFEKCRSVHFALHGYYAGRSPSCFSFADANLIRKYGPEWQTACEELTHKRLHSWGLNTIGNWSDEKTQLLDRTPYTDTIITFKQIEPEPETMIQGTEGYWSKFPDVFIPGFPETVRRAMAAKVGKSTGDPWCLGYFSDNEMSWGDEISIGLGALKSPPDQAAKKEFVADLKAKYGSIAKLNAAWGAKHASWDALLASREVPDERKAHSDLTAFYTRTAETYFRTIRDAIKAVAPHQLYLGCRFASACDRAAVAATKYCDVVSYNLYRPSIEDYQFAGDDKPTLVGEFHFAALDRGVFNINGTPVANQAARAQAYKEYVLGAVGHPMVVGTHWFQWKDQPVTGRPYNEENGQIGFLDVADSPYPEMIQASREIAADLYQVRSGK